MLIGSCSSDPPEIFGGESRTHIKCNRFSTPASLPLGLRSKMNYPTTTQDTVLVVLLANPVPIPLIPLLGEDDRMAGHLAPRWHIS